MEPTEGSAFKGTKIPPTHIVGDFDSASGDALEYFIPIRTFNPVKAISGGFLSSAAPGIIGGKSSFFPMVAEKECILAG